MSHPKLSPQLRPAIFLDRDGTLNRDPGYLNDATQLELLPTVAQALNELSQAGFLLYVVSNQSGVARGLISQANLELIHTRLQCLIAPARVQKFLLCMHHPDEACPCRKPKPFFALQTALEDRLDLTRSYMIGDRISDYFFGLNAEMKNSLIVRTGHGLETETSLSAQINSPALVFDHLKQASDWILSQET